jgi:hypothetical protein
VEKNTIPFSAKKQTLSGFFASVGKNKKAFPTEKPFVKLSPAILSFVRGTSFFYKRLSRQPSLLMRYFLRSSSLSQKSTSPSQVILPLS